MNNKLTFNDINNLIELLSDKVMNKYNPDIVVGIADGGIIPAILLAKKLNIEFIPIKISRDKAKSKKTEIRKWVSIPVDTYIKDKNILVLDDFSYSGYTLKMAKAGLLSLGASDVKLAVLYHIWAFQGWKFKPDFAVEIGIKKLPEFPY